MKSFASVAVLAGGALAAITSEPSYIISSFPPVSTPSPAPSAIESEAPSIKPIISTSNIKGKGFTKFYSIWFENTDYNSTAADPNFQWLATQGILLKNYFAITHPSEPNYVSSVAGDQFGMASDDWFQLPKNISTVADMLDFGGISWAEYQQDIPYAGYPGLNFSNQATGANDYMRKHDPLIVFDNVSLNSSRARKIKGFNDMTDDINNKQLPQWAFITPNMTNDAHDTNVTFAGQWLRSFLPPLLNNSYFMEDTLILVTFDENEEYTIPNRVYSVLLGGAVPDSLKGTTDSTYYNHYSAISTVAVNFDLPQLGRWDCSANVFATVANKAGYQNAGVDLDNLYFNSTYPGPVNVDDFTPGWWPAPNTEAKCASGRGVLPAIKSTWGKTTGSFNYTNVYPYNSLSDTNNGGKPVIGINDRSSSSSSSSSSTGTATGTSTSTGTSTGSAAASTTTGAAALISVPEFSGLLGIAGLAALFL